ncbi:MAG: 50S ribosomal protein L11 [Candidatus Bathyarchaeota archaeon]|nr:MAG: 50S ribosomal protein L11 [Candidatus Bathyarchaeota archaeon]
MSEKKVVEALINGGQATGGPPLGPTLGPLGLNVLAVVKKINEITQDYAGMKVPIKIQIDLETKGFEVIVGTPTTAALIVKELGVSKGSGNPNTQKIGNLTMEQISHIAKIKQNVLLSKTLKGAMKEIIGTCMSLGVTIEGKEPNEIQVEIEKGLFDEFLKE